MGHLLVDTSIFSVLQYVLGLVFVFSQSRLYHNQMLAYFNYRAENLHKYTLYFLIVYMFYRSISIVFFMGMVSKTGLNFFQDPFENGIFYRIIFLVVRDTGMTCDTKGKSLRYPIRTSTLYTLYQTNGF